MQSYTLPREAFNLLLEVFGERQKGGNIRPGHGVRHRGN